jgi:hypothetical protein
MMTATRVRFRAGSNAATVALGLLALVVVGCASPEDTSEADASAAQVEQAADVLQFDNLVRTVTILSDKFAALAGAMPEEAYDWRPMEGVRSVSDVYVHIAADNFFVPALMGIAAPPPTGITNDVQTFRAYQQRDMSRDEVIAGVGASFDFLLAAMEETRGELDRVMTLGGSETSVGDIWIRAVTHLHEHLGQSIAYARANEVVPPWSG